MSIISSNAYLGVEQAYDNAKYIYDYLVNNGWSKNAVCAMLGNMQSESTINPGIWENLDSSNSSGGYGLVQWTPSTKYIDWAIGQGYEYEWQYSQLLPQLKRIEYELANNIQWIATDLYPMTFLAFSKSSRSVEELALAFLHNYERPADLNQPNRSSQARYWYDLLSGSSSGGTGVNDSRFIYPVSTFLTITQGFIDGEHYALDLGWSSSYNGADGQSIIASQSGIVIIAVDGKDNTYDSGVPDYGNYVIIDHGNNIYTVYGHLEKGSVAVSVGQTVTRGQHLGNMGDSGYSNGQHLHFELRIGGNSQSYAVDPINYLVAPSTLYINPSSLFYNLIQVVNFVTTVRRNKKGYNFVLFNRERRKRLWNAMI